MRPQQLDLIERPQVTRATRLKAARVKADVGIERVTEATEVRNPGWCGQAVEAVRRFARHQGGVFCMEICRAVIERELPAPSDLRVWGQVTRMALARGYIKPAKGQFFLAASSNNSPKPAYTKGPKA